MSDPVDEVRVEKLLGRKVHDVDGKRVGRIAEVVARKEGDEFVVAGYIVGPVAWVHRVAVAGLGLRMRGIGRVCRVEWDRMDLSDPARPRVTCRSDELTREILPPRKRGLARRPARRLA
jgi:sporulation protein YlmC with PRC-barrel domain